MQHTRAETCDEEGVAYIGPTRRRPMTSTIAGFIPTSSCRGRGGSNRTVMQSVRGPAERTFVLLSYCGLVFSMAFLPEHVL